MERRKVFNYIFSVTYSTSAIMKVERDNKTEKKKKRKRKIVETLDVIISVLIFSPLDFNPQLGRHNNKVVWIHQIGITAYFSVKHYQCGKHAIEICIHLLT